MQEWHQELQASVPVTQQQHHANQIKDSYHSTRQVIRHMKNLEEEHKEKKVSGFIKELAFAQDGVLLSNTNHYFAY